MSDDKSTLLDNDLDHPVDLEDVVHRPEPEVQRRADAAEDDDHQQALTDVDGGQS